MTYLLLAYDSGEVYMALHVEQMPGRVEEVAGVRICHVGLENGFSDWIEVGPDYVQFPMSNGVQTTLTKKRAKAIAAVYGIELPT